MSCAHDWVRITTLKHRRNWLYMSCRRCGVSGRGPRSWITRAINPDRFEVGRP